MDDDLLLLSTSQMRRIKPFFPLSHDVPRVTDLRDLVVGQAYLLANFFRHFSQN